MRYQSAIYGLQIHLNERVPGLKFSTLHSGTPDLQIDFGAFPAWFENNRLTRELRYVRSNGEATAKPRLAVWSVGDYYHLQYADGTEFLVDNAGTRVWATWPADTLTVEDTATYLLGPIMGFVLLLRGFISLHACAVAIRDQAIAIVGPAGSGKSTTAAAFAELGYAILAEDVVTLRDRGDQFLVQPGYPSIRLWPSSVEALYGAAATLPKLTPTWDKCYLDLTQEKYEFQQQPLPLGAIYLLGERKDQAPSISTIAPAEALMSLVANTYATYLMDKTMRAREFEILNRVLNSVPIKRVTPHSDPRHIGELCQTIIRDV
ncbi:MAG TPA: hypothetical protein VFS76_07560 [Pyrinomonadaceae bacterium]|nr:hypothetical protein [Pyrinomonadaceae bacterium]